MVLLIELPHQDESSMQKSEYRQIRVKTKLQAGASFGRPLGDVVADFTAATGLDQVAACYTRSTGKPCGCEARHAFLNKVFPF